jgi:regulator of nucleoside diphosphate kinase
MPTNASIERTLTELDVARLKKLRGGQLPDDLADNVKFSDQVASQDIASDVVTMNSQVELRDLRSQTRQKLTICYPVDASRRQPAGPAGGCRGPLAVSHW